MNKLYFPLIILIFSMMVFSSCDLDEYNPSAATAEMIWNTTPEGFQTLVNVAYGPRQEMYGKMNALLACEAGTDAWFKLGINGWGQMFAYSLKADYVIVNKMWTCSYVGINYCNSGIERIKNVNFSSESDKNSKEAELRFLRAFYYWHLVETFGPVPLNILESEAPSLTIKRNSVEKIYDVIFEDIEIAAKNLPVKYDDENYGRATKPGAYGFFARALLSRAYYSLDKNNKIEADSYFTKAKEIAHAVIDSASIWDISLYSNYADLWNNVIPGGNNKNCKEALHIISFPTNLAFSYDGKGNVCHQYFVWNYNNELGMIVDLENGKTSGLFMPTKSLLDMYDETKDSRYKGSFKDTWIENKPEGYTWTLSDCKLWNKDESLAGTLINAGDTAIFISKREVPDKNIRKYGVSDVNDLYANDTTILYSRSKGPALKKFMDPNRAAPTSEPGVLDLIFMRLAEMYLIAAEAEFHLGELQQAADDINVIRRRASLSGTNEMDIVATDVSLNFILDERAREFIGEHQRWYDLKRTRLLVPRIQQYNKQLYSRIPSNLLEKGNGVFENCLLRPIPQAELNALLNVKEFGQNPGY